MAQPTTAPATSTRLGRKPKFSLPLFERVLAHIIAGESTYPSIEREGMSPRRFYDQLTKHPDLAPRIQAAQLDRDRVRNVKRIEDAELELKRRGIDGWTEPIFDAKGTQCGERRRFSDACLIFFLKSHKPEIYSDKPTTIVATQVNITPDREKEILREWRQRLGAVEPAPPKKD